MPAKNPFRPGGDEAVANSLDIARDTFAWLVTGPHPVSLNGRLFDGLPDRDVPLDEVRDHMLARRCPQATGDAVWAHLVLRSRSEGATWTVAAVGMAMPALTAVAAKLTARFAGDPADVHAEILHGFLAALTTIDLCRPRIMLRLRWAAYRSGYDALNEALSGPTPVAPGFRSAAPHPPWGHPDLVLARAVADGVLTRSEATLIGATRLEGVPVSEWAESHEATTWAVYKARKRAEIRLAEYLHDTATGADPADPVANEVARRTSPSDAGARTPAAPRPSQPVTAIVGAAERRDEQPVSKTTPESGVQGYGTDARSTRSSELPPCD
ncbi:hypothetical protein [Amycolatopsis sp. NPDC051372]|uniref:hypothetical protein n=1 Tax=Amycolatopsis sp. NPDC051372 TaxID=3155669 RepID=UPI003448FDEB